MAPAATPTARPPFIDVKVEPGQVIVTDDAWTSEDLSGEEDLDSPDEMALMIRWNFTENDYSEYHLYVKTGEMTPYEYLGKQMAGERQDFLWIANQQNLSSVFQAGPQFRHTYQFHVYGLTTDGDPLFRGPIGTLGPVGYAASSLVDPTPTPTGQPTMNPEESPTPTVTPTPTQNLLQISLVAGQVIVTDDGVSVEDLAGGVDKDAPNERELMIRWSFAEQDYIEYHVYVYSNLMMEPQYLGKQPSGVESHFQWNQDNPDVAPDFSDGPQFGQDYVFWVYGITVGGEPVYRGPIQSTAPIEFREME